jgi:hypothetical protein
VMKGLNPRVKQQRLLFNRRTPRGGHPKTYQQTPTFLQH